jgi:hypothetical protein
MAIQFRKNLGEMMAPGMKGQQDAAALMEYQGGDSRLTGTPAAPRVAQMEYLRKPLVSDMEANRQLSGEVFSPGAPAAPPPRTIVTRTPAQTREGQLTMSSDRQAAAAQIDGVNASHFANEVAAAQATQRLMDELRGASAGYQQRDTTGAFVDAQEFANQAIWDVMPAQGRQVVDNTMLRLSQRVG